MAGGDGTGGTPARAKTGPQGPPSGPLRRQPPVRSPLSRAAVVDACRTALDRGEDPHGRLLQLLRRRYQADEVLLCDSGTSALEIAIRVCREEVGDGSPVALPAYTCFDVATAAIGAGASVVFYDLDPETLGPDPASFVATLKRGARCAVVSHLWGLPVRWEPLQAAARTYGAILVEDAAQGHGAFLRGRRLGALGRIGVLSFGRGKGWTGGGGGAVLTRFMGGGYLRKHVPLPSPGWKGELTKLVSVAGHAALADPSRYWLPAALPWLHLGESVYHEPAPATSMTRLSAALIHRTGLAAARSAEARRHRAARFVEELADIPGVRTIAPAEDAVPGYLRLPVLLPRGMEGVQPSSAARRLGIEASYPTPLPHLAAVRPRIAHPVGSFPGAESLVRRLVTLPTHDGLTPVEVRQVLRLLDGRRRVSTGRQPPPRPADDRRPSPTGSV